MLLRISLGIAILASLAAGVISFKYVQDIIVATRQERDDWHKKDSAEIAAHNTTKKNLAETKSKLETTTKNLEQTKTALSAANNKVDELTKNNADLTAKLDKTTGERDEAQQQLERWRGLPDPVQIKEIIADLEKTRKARDAFIAENKLLASKLKDSLDRWDQYFGTNADVPLPAGLRGKILAVDPKYDFVVLNIGDDQGAKQRGVMMVDRNGILLGKVRIQTVYKDRCVANILPDWQKAPIMEGDEVLY
jgi:hypothetical protein